MTDALPADIRRILGDVAEQARSYRGIGTGRIQLQRRDVQRLKWDMTENRHRWLRERVSIGAVRAECLELEFTQKDTDTIVDLVRKAQTRHVFRPDAKYEGYEYPYPITQRRTDA